MAKKRKASKRKAPKRKAKARPRAKARRPKARRAKSQPGVVGAIEEAAALRRRLAGRNTFED
jgi:hypothetical protein